jgi:hypothetical protein
VLEPSEEPAMASTTSERSGKSKAPDVIGRDSDEPAHVELLVVLFTDDLKIVARHAKDAPGRQRSKLNRLAIRVEQDLENGLTEVAEVGRGGIDELDDGFVEAAVLELPNMKKVAEPCFPVAVSRLHLHAEVGPISRASDRKDAQRNVPRQKERMSTRRRPFTRGEVANCAALDVRCCHWLLPAPVSSLVG